MPDNYERITSTFKKLQKFLGALSQTEIDALDSNTLVKGYWVVNTTTPTIQVWDGTQWI